MYQTKRGNEWHTGVKAPIDVDSNWSMVRSWVAGTAPKVVMQCSGLLRGEYHSVAHVNAFFLGAEKRPDG
jgi:hypothetical protein